jgi:hypothetical protein
MGLTIARSQPIAIQGERATRVLGVAKGEATVRRGENIVLIHGNRLYVLTAVQIGDAKPGKLEERFTKFLAGFRFR